MSKELAKTYDPKGLEDRLYQKWLDKGYFHATVNPNKKKRNKRNKGSRDDRGRECIFGNA